MTIQQILFMIVAAATLGAALMVVSVPNLIHAALWLIGTLFGVAILFVFLSVGFLAVAQVVIYIGAIAILMIFAIMLTRGTATETGSHLNSSWMWAAIFCMALFGVMVFIFSQWSGIATTTQPMPDGYDPVQLLGAALVAPNGFVLPFELASVLLLAALIGSIMVAWGKK